ncbi:MAG: MBL fold metallo-hydrolase [Candidatus Bathyarchaeia archaeon]
MSLRNLGIMAITRGKVALALFNEYSGTIVKTPGLTTVFDPVGIGLGELPRTDLIVVTHEHYDHLDGRLVASLQARDGATVATTPFVARQLRGIPSDRLKPMKPGEELDIRGLKLNAEVSDHPGNQPLTFVLTTEDGIRIYHSSDSRPYPGMRGLGDKYKPDIALCTVGIAPGTSPRSGVEVARLVKPKVAIPYHTDDERALEEFVRILAEQEPSIRTKILKRFQIFLYPE